MEMIQLYKKGNPDRLIKTINGPITYYDFLCEEKHRLELLGRIAELKGGGSKGHGCHEDICLLVNKLA